MIECGLNFELSLIAACNAHVKVCIQSFATVVEYTQVSRLSFVRTLQIQQSNVTSGSKRARIAWEDCDDVDELKQHLCKQQDQIEKLRKDKAELTKALRGAEGQAVDQSPEELKAQADRMRKSLKSNILAQMVYRNKTNTSRDTADIPNLSQSQV